MADAGMSDIHIPRQVLLNRLAQDESQLKIFNLTQSLKEIYEKQSNPHR